MVVASLVTCTLHLTYSQLTMEPQSNNILDSEAIHPVSNWTVLISSSPLHSNTKHCLIINSLTYILDLHSSTQIRIAPPHSHSRSTSIPSGRCCCPRPSSMQCVSSCAHSLTQNGRDPAQHRYWDASDELRLAMRFPTSIIGALWMPSFGSYG